MSRSTMTAAMPRTAPLAARRASGRAPRRSLRARASLSNGGGHKSTIHRIIAENNGIVVVPGCYDALSALCLTQAGHKAGFVSGAAVSAALLGAPDIGVLTPPEMAARTAQIAAAAPGLPVIVDADSGGGSPLNVQRTVRELLAAGAKGCVLEDQRWPKRLGYMRTKEIVSPESMVAKLLAAREVIGDADFFLVARTDARSTSARRGLDDAIARANLYVDAGADAHLVGGLRSSEELAAVGARTQGLRVANMVEGGVTPLAAAAALAAQGFHLAQFPLSAIFAATRALQEAYGGLAATGGSESSWEGMVSWRAFNGVLGLEEAFDREDHFTRVQGPASNIEDRLRIKVRGLVKPARQ